MVVFLLSITEHLCTEVDIAIYGVNDNRMVTCLIDGQVARSVTTVNRVEYFLHWQ